jgi:hypothetical protein
MRRLKIDDASRKSAPEILAAQKIVNAASRAVISREKGLEKRRIEKKIVELLTDFERKQEKELKAQNVAIKAQAKEQKIITARAFLNAAQFFCTIDLLLFKSF